MTKGHIEFVLSGYGVPFTDALADKLLEMFDEEAASYQHTINELNKALSIENKGEWIPVSERLPKDSEDVLATDGVDMFVAWHNPDKGWGYPEKGWHSFDDNFDVRTPIIAWQPLPEPYKAESEDKE